MKIEIVFISGGIEEEGRTEERDARIDKER